MIKDAVTVSKVGFMTNPQTEIANTIEASNYKKPPIVAYEVYDARGNGDGKICPTITGDHENRITDYTAVAVKLDAYPKWGGNVGTIDAHIAQTPGMRGGNERTIIFGEIYE